MENFEELEVLGRGAFGTVTLCKSLSENKRLVVLKEIEAQDTPEVTEAEVKVASSFSHPLIVRFFGQFSHRGNVFIIMEYMAGGTLSHFLANKGGELLTQDEVLHLFAQLVIAIEHIHSKNVLHRDIKCKNILLSADFTVAKIGDFGISKVLESRSRSGSIVGTPQYFSPELCRGESYGNKSDVWALGCVLYELMTLSRPFQGSSVPALAVKILAGRVEPPSEGKYSPVLRQLLKDMMHPEPAERVSIKACATCPLVALKIVSLACSLGFVGKWGKR